METIENLKIAYIRKMRNVNLDTQMDTLGKLDTQMGVQNSILVSNGHPGRPLHKGPHELMNIM